MVRSWLRQRMRSLDEALGLRYPGRPDGSEAGKSRYAFWAYTTVSDVLDHDLDDLRRRVERLEERLDLDAR
jgi:hypothetical protein